MSALLVRGVFASLLLTLGAAAGAEPAPGQAGAMRVVGESGWQVSEPVGFILQRREKKAAYMFSWERAWKEALSVKGAVSLRRHKEVIRLYYDKDFQWSPGDQLPRDCGGRKVLGQTIEGRQYGSPSLSYVCEEDARRQSDTHVYYVAFEGLEEIDEVQTWKRITLKYHHEWDLPSLPPPLEKTPHLQDFRIMEGTLAPVAGELRFPIESLSEREEAR